MSPVPGFGPDSRESGPNRTRWTTKEVRWVVNEQAVIVIAKRRSPEKLYNWYDERVERRVWCKLASPLGRRCTRVKVIRVEVSQNVVHARTTGWMTSTRPGKLRDFGLQPRRSNPRSRNLFWALGVKSTWFLNFGGQAKCKLILVVDSWPSLVVFGVVIPLWVKKHE